MKHVVPVRKSLGVRTIFNILGPLLNPARADRLFLGVFSPHLLDIYGKVLNGLGVKHALVVHCCGLDELAPIGVADAVEIREGQGVKRIKIDTLSLGVKKCKISDLRGGSKDVNAKIILEVLQGKRKDAITDTIAMNAGAGLYVSGVAKSIQEGMKMAMDAMNSGKAMKTLEKWSNVSMQLDSKKMRRSPS